MSIIMVTSFDVASNTDILQGTRLQAAPSNGVLSFELQASDNDATNRYLVTINLPNGDTPLDGVMVPQGATAGLAGMIDDRLALKVRFRISQGGHCVFSVTEVGDAEVFSRVVFTPDRKRVALAR